MHKGLRTISQPPYLTPNMVLLGTAPSPRCTPSNHLGLFSAQKCPRSGGDSRVGGGSPVSQAQTSIEPTTKHAQDVLSNPNPSSATVVPHIQPLKLPAWSTTPVHSPSPTGKPLQTAPVPMAFSSFLRSILSPSVFSNMCLRVASGDGGSLQRTI